MGHSGELDENRWERFSALAACDVARRWILVEVALGRARNTVDAYARGVDDFLVFCNRNGVTATAAARADVAQYVGDLRRRPSPHGRNIVAFDSGVGLANATLQQRLTALRLFFDFVVEEGLRDVNPLGRGRHAVGSGVAGRPERQLVRRFKRLPWIPSDEQWQHFLSEAKQEPIRNRCMIGLAYDAALRRQELCALRADDLDPAYRLIRVRAESTKSGRERMVPYSAASGELLRAYLAVRHVAAHDTRHLFLSESRRNRAAPITVWTWSKVIRRIADRAGLPQFSTHSLRHLSLTDLARSGWDLHEIACFAGHSNTETTQLYVHLSGRDLAKRLADSVAGIHTARVIHIGKDFLDQEDLQ